MNRVSHCDMHDQAICMCVKLVEVTKELIVSERFGPSVSAELSNRTNSTVVSNDVRASQYRASQTH